MGPLLPARGSQRRLPNAPAPPVVDRVETSTETTPQTLREVGTTALLSRRPLGANRRRGGVVATDDDADRSVSLPRRRDPHPLGLSASTPALALRDSWRAGCGESRMSGSVSGLGKRTRSDPGTAPQADSPGTATTDPPR